MSFRFFVQKSVLVCLVFLLPSLCQAAFVEEQFSKLEKEIRKANDLKSLAEKIADWRDYKSWQDSIDEDLKLYIGISWLQQNHFKPATDFLLPIEPSRSHLDIWRYYQGVALIHLGKLNQASMVLADLETRHADDEDFLYLKSILQSERNQLTDAITTLDHLLKKSKKQGKAYLQRGLLHMLAFSHEKAIKDFKKAGRYLSKEDKQSRQQAMFQLGLIYLRVKLDQDKASKYFNEGIKLDPDSEMVVQLRQVLQQR